MSLILVLLIAVYIASKHLGFQRAVDGSLLVRGCCSSGVAARPGDERLATTGVERRSERLATTGAKRRYELAPRVSDPSAAH